jgi:hypothetical protein
LTQDLARKWMVMIGLAGIALSTGGCFRSYGPKPIKGWSGQPVIIEHLERIPENEGRLQIICGYTPPLFSHAAMRLVTPDKGTLFWDPGGDYAKGDSADPREKDLVVNPPSLGQYIVFRLDMLGDRGGEIFEWDITREKADELYDALVNGRSKVDPGGAFTSNAVPSQCSLKVSGFAKRFAPEVTNLKHQEFYPYDLGQRCWRLNPDRVIVYQKKKPLLVYTR